MGRKKGKPAYPKKTEGPNTYITTKEAALKVKAKERMTGKSRSDIITYCILKAVDSITKDTFVKDFAA